VADLRDNRPWGAGGAAAAAGPASAHPLATRWAELWATDPVALAATCYAETASLSRAAHDTQPLTGRDRVADVAAQVARAVPDRTVELLRLIDAGSTLVAEWRFLGRGVDDLVTMAAPGLTWWELDPDGRIQHELRVLDWAGRRIAEAVTTPLGSPAGARARSRGWYRDFAERLLEIVGPYPELALASTYRSGAERVGVVPAPTDEDPTATGQDPTATGGPGALRLVGVAGQGDALAVRFEAIGGTGSLAGVSVLTLDESDRVVAERWYHGSWWLPTP